MFLTVLFSHRGEAASLHQTDGTIFVHGTTILRIKVISRKKWTFMIIERQPSPAKHLHGAAWGERQPRCDEGSSCSLHHDRRGRRRNVNLDRRRRAGVGNDLLVQPPHLEEEPESDEDSEDVPECAGVPEDGADESGNSHEHGCVEKVIPTLLSSS